jgi:hypothetical protein
MRLIEDQPVVFLHIPKTAGCTLNAIIERQYSSEQIFSFYSGEAFDEFQNLSQDRREKIKMFRGHIAFESHEHVLGDFDPYPDNYFTFLRDPVDRVISHYYHVIRNPDNNLYPYTEEGQLGLEDFLKTKNPTMLNNGQTRLLSGLWKDVPFGECDVEMLEIAKRNFREHFVLVGLTERFDASICLLRIILGWQNSISYVSKNVGDNRPKRGLMSPETLAVISEFNQLDIALYEYAEQLFDEQVRGYGSSLAIQLEALQAQSRFKALSDDADIMMRDYEVKSDFPMINEWIVEVRRNLTSHLREPYVDPTFERQVEFNRRVLQEMQALAATQDKLLMRIMELEEGAENQPGG